MSDEFISDRKTFCTILDRKEIFEISNNGFLFSGHVTPEEMEMSEIILRIEWKHFRIPAGPAPGRHCPLKSRNLGFGHLGTFVQSFWKFEKWEVPKKMLPIQSKLFWADGTGLLGIGGLAVALSPENVQVLRERRTCAPLLSLDIPFPTLRFLDCRDPGCAPGNEERWSWVAARL